MWRFVCLFVCFLFLFFFLIEHRIYWTLATYNSYDYNLQWCCHQFSKSVSCYCYFSVGLQFTLQVLGPLSLLPLTSLLVWASNIGSASLVLKLSLCHRHSNAWLTVNPLTPSGTASSCSRLSCLELCPITDYLEFYPINDSFEALSNKYCNTVKKSQVDFATDGQSANLSWCQSPIWDLWRIVLCLIIVFRLLWVYSYGAPSLMRGWVCSFQLLLGLANAVFLGSESHETHDHILLF
jgi:hypothetical protein